MAFGLGGLIGTAASDMAQWLISSPGAAYASVFGFEAALFVLSAVLAWQVGKPVKQDVPATQGKPMSFSSASST